MGSGKVVCAGDLK